VDGGTTVAVESNAEDFTGTTVPAESTAVSVSFLLGSILCDRAVIMNEQRQEAYLKLIDQLLVSPAELEEAILRRNSHLIDAGLIQKLEQEAEL
jgi:hypothetical protein